MSLDELVRIKKETDAKLKEQGEAAVKAELRALFDAHPCLNAVRWDQYTPYFNDGEACTFSVNEPDVKCEGLVGGYEADDGWMETWGRHEGSSPDALAAVKAVKALYSKLQTIDDVLQATLGDHSTITCTRDGIEVDECSHD